MPDKKIDMGFMKFPISGDFNMLIATGGILWACAWTIGVFNMGDFMGPAIYYQSDPAAFMEACSKPLIVTVLWCFVYYTYVAVQVGTFFNIAAFEMFTDKDVTDKYAYNASRFAGNMFDQGPVFLVMMWSYCMFVDYSTGGNLGYLYIVSRLIYPFMYMFNHRFKMWFEWCTQIGYGVMGVYMLGVLMNGLGTPTDNLNEFGFNKFANDSSFVAPLVGFFVGSLGIFPYSNPLSIFYGWAHYKTDRMFLEKPTASDAEAGIET